MFSESSFMAVYIFRVILVTIAQSYQILERALNSSSWRNSFSWECFSPKKPIIFHYRYFFGSSYSCEAPSSGFCLLAAFSSFKIFSLSSNSSTMCRRPLSNSPSSFTCIPNGSFSSLSFIFNFFIKSFNLSLVERSLTLNRDCSIALRASLLLFQRFPYSTDP